MTTIYCSLKLVTLLDVPRKSKELNQDASDTAGWNAMLFYLNKRKCLLFMHKPTLYCFLALDIVKKDLIEFNRFFLQHLTDQLFADRLLSEKTKSFLDSISENILLKPTDNDKRIIGSMNDCIYRIRFYSQRDDSQSLNPTYIGRHLNETPMGALKHAFPVDMMKVFIENQAVGKS